MAQICQGTYDPIVAPTRIFPRHLHDQAFCFLIYLGAPYTSTESRPIKFVRDELPIPTQNRIGLGRCRHVLQCLSTQAVSDLGQCRLFSFRKQQPTLDLTSQDAVLRRQIFVSQQEFLIDCSGDIGEQARPKHLRFPCNLDFVKREIVGAVSRLEKPNSKREPVQNPKLRYFKPFEFFDHTSTVSMTYCKLFP